MSLNKNKILGVRLSDKHLQELNILSEQKNLNRSTLARKAIINLLKKNEKGFM